MTEANHHIRLVAGFEISAAHLATRRLTRADCERLASALADDLARIEPTASEAMLVVGGSLMEPAELLRPGFPAWQALADLARPAILEHGTMGQVLAIGSHQGRYPDARLKPADAPAGGHFLALPAMLIGGGSAINDMQARLEEKLFERGGLHPPAQAIMSEAAECQIVHGQWLTLADLLALQHVQMDAAGLGAFWPVVEQVVTAEDQSQAFELPAGLEVSWHADRQEAVIRFLSLDQSEASVDDYALWTRAFRSLTALLDSHALAWRCVSELDHDPDRHCLVEHAGPVRASDGLTEHTHPECGLMAWTVVENGQQRNLYPLSNQAVVAVHRALRPDAGDNGTPGICYDPATRKLSPRQ